MEKLSELGVAPVQAFWCVNQPSSNLSTEFSKFKHTNEDGLGLLQTYRRVFTAKMQTQTSMTHCYVSLSSTVMAFSSWVWNQQMRRPGNRNSTVCVFKVSACLELIIWDDVTSEKVTAGHLRNNRWCFLEQHWMTEGQYIHFPLCRTLLENRSICICLIGVKQPTLTYCEKCP